MVVLFLLAVVAVVIAVDFVLAGLWMWGSSEIHTSPGKEPGFFALLNMVPRQLWVWGAVGTAAVILVVSTVNTARLAGGGQAVAKMVGARLVAPATVEPLERRLRNVVEEMAIAAGVRVPAVYVMDGERGINAFAAGWEVSGSVVAVTRGTLETLTRDELQGVVGHEFSHILNGDMRLNVRMIGVLAGIVFIGSIGEFIMRSTRESRKGGQLFLAGLALLIVGYVGLFFARLIKASVSRQREFLADASSVQFTRNPDGIAGALDQIRATGAGAPMASRYAEELSHMFFSRGVKVWAAGLFDTHPPLDERIRRVQPRFQPSAYRQRRAAEAAALSATPEGVAALTGVQPLGRRGGDAGARWGRSAVQSAQLVGTLDAGKIDYAARLLESLPVLLREALREADGACAALVALLLAPAEDALRIQLAALEAAGLGALAGGARAMHAHTRGLGPAFRLPVIDLALPALKAAPDAVKRDLVAALETVAHADRRVSLHEFVVLALVREQLAPKAKPAATPGRKLADLQAEAATLLSLIAHAGTRADATGARQAALQTALEAGCKIIGIPAQAAAGAALNLEAARGALEALKALAPMQKAVLVKALFAAATADGTIRVGEAELMRLAGAVLDCPLPPLLAELDPASLPA